MCVIICTWRKKAWGEIVRRIENGLNWLREKAFGKKSGKKQSSSSSSASSSCPSPSSVMSQGPPKSHFGSSFNMNQVSQNKSQKRSGPSSGMNKVPNNKRSDMNQKPQNEPQSRTSSSSYSCPHRRCTRTFETIDGMNRHFSRHNGNKRR
jgi:hypothetical protein